MVSSIFFGILTLLRVHLASPGAPSINEIAAIAEIHVDRVALALVKTAPRYLTLDKAKPHVRAALKAQSVTGVPVEILLAMGYVESRYNPASTSRVYNAKRVTGPLGERKPRGVRGPYFCGVIQAIAKHSWQRCLDLRNLDTGYLTGAQEIKRWQQGCYRKGYRSSKTNSYCTFAGYGGGWKAVTRGTSTYPYRVTTRAARIRQGVNRLLAKTSRAGL